MGSLVAMVRAEDLDPKPLLRDGDHLIGLAENWESESAIRRPAIKEGGLLQWPIGETGRKMVGVINFPAIKANKEVVAHLLHSWCPDAEDRKTVPISCVKPQAGPVASDVVSNKFLDSTSYSMTVFPPWLDSNLPSKSQVARELVIGPL